MCLIDDAFRFVEEIIVEALHYPSCGIREHRGLVIVAVGVQAVDLIISPQSPIDIILDGKERLEIDKHYDWLARNLPAPDAHIERLGCRSLSPISP